MHEFNVGDKVAMTYKENIKAILECYFTGFKEEIIDSACNRILEQVSCENAISRQDVLDLAKKGVLVSNGNYKSVCKAINDLPPVNPQKSKMDLDELKRRILMEVDGGTDDRMLRYCDVCDRISNSIDKYKEESEG